MSSPNPGGPASPYAPATVLKRFWYLPLLTLVVVAGFCYWVLFVGFYDVGYAPSQPIAYSHRLHAGEYGMDCQYCHWNAAKGKHAGVPPASVCLGCHGSDKGQVGAGLPEVARLLAMIEHGPDGSYDITTADGRRVRKEGGVVHWERVHLLPDHVYFSHEWHVGAGVACQTCHGPIEEMEVVYQYEDLSMGWCIQCHRQDTYVGGQEYLADGEITEAWNAIKALRQAGDETKAAALEAEIAAKVERQSRSFRVGVGDYDVLRSRIRPDDVVEMVKEMDRIAADGRSGDGSGDTHGGGYDEHHLPTGARPMRGIHDPGESEGGFTLAYFTDGQEARLKELLAAYPDLPRWRIQDLPETHRAFYGAETGLEHLQNAPTHCNTCHQ